MNLLSKTVLLTAAIALSACSSNDADAPAGTGNGDGDQSPAMQDDLLAIGDRSADSDPVLLDIDALSSQSMALFGDPDTSDPFEVEDDDTVDSVLKRY